MSSSFSISIAECYWQPIAGVPKDGSMVFIRDNEEVVDLARWDDGELNTEFGACSTPTWFALISIS